MSRHRNLLPNIGLRTPSASEGLPLRARPWHFETGPCRHRRQTFGGLRMSTLSTPSPASSRSRPAGGLPAETLYHDIVGASPAMQRILKLGARATRLVDARLVAATHRDLRALVDAGRLREDLYYRLNVVRIELPPLRERRGDIGLLASYFLSRIAERRGRSGLSFSPETVE